MHRQISEADALLHLVAVSTGSGVPDNLVVEPNRLVAVTVWTVCLETKLQDFYVYNTK